MRDTIVPEGMLAGLKSATTYLGPVLSFIATTAATYFSLLPSFSSPARPLGWVGHVGLIFISGCLGLFVSIGSVLAIKQLVKRNVEIQRMQSNLHIGLQDSMDAFTIPNMRQLLTRQAQELTNRIVTEYKRQPTRLDLHVFILAGDEWKIIASSADPSTTNVHRMALKPDEGVVGYISKFAAPTVLEVKTIKIFNRFREELGTEQPLQPRNRGLLGGSITWIYSEPIWARSFLPDPKNSNTTVGILTFDDVDQSADAYFFNRDFQNNLTACSYEVAPYVTLYATVRAHGQASNLRGK